MTFQKAAVIPSKGIGDALMMMISAHHLQKNGIEVTTFHPALHELRDWFPGQHFENEFNFEKIQSFDLVIVENDNSSKIKKLLAAFEKKELKYLSIFYPSYLSIKHASLSSLDQVFDPHLTMVENISLATARLLSLPASKFNGIVFPFGLVHRLYKNRILIHPTSSQKEKNWHSSKYLKLAEKLKNKGFDPCFIVHEYERENWKNVLKLGFDLPHFPHLSDLAAFTYQSGYVIGNDSLLGHLASNLGIPNWIIANDYKRMQLWRPGWLEGKVITPPFWIPNFKFLRIKKKYWQHCITTHQVLSNFETS